MSDTENGMVTLERVKLWKIKLLWYTISEERIAKLTYKGVFKTKFCQKDLRLARLTQKQKLKLKIYDKLGWRFV